MWPLQFGENPEACGVPPKGEKESSAPQAGAKWVGHPRLPHSPVRCVFAAECGTSRARACALSCPRTLWLWPLLRERLRPGLLAARKR
jgi:hypothetical protein